MKAEHPSMGVHVYGSTWNNEGWGLMDNVSLDDSKIYFIKAPWRVNFMTHPYAGFPTQSFIHFTLLILFFCIPGTISQANLLYLLLSWAL